MKNTLRCQRELKTKQNNGDVEAFLNGVDNEQRRKDALVVFDIMKEITGEPPKLWGPTIVGFGKYKYRYRTGREGEWFVTGFSPRKQSLTLYIMEGFNKHEELMAKLGKFKTGVSCLYVNKLSDIDIEVLKELITLSVDYVKNNLDVNKEGVDYTN